MIIHPLSYAQHSLIQIALQQQSMHINRVIKTKNNQYQDAYRFQTIKPKKDHKLTYETVQSNFQININPEKMNLLHEKITKYNVHQNKKVKSILNIRTAYDLLEIRSHSQRKSRSKRLSPCSNIDNQNQYELGKAKRGKKKEDAHKKEKEKDLHKDISNNRIKMRTPKAKSLSIKTLNIRFTSPKKTPASKQAGITHHIPSSKNCENTHNSKKHQSPQNLMIQKSYYFKNSDKQQQKMIQRSNKEQKTTKDNLLLPKKLNRYIFQSENNVWNDKHNRLLKSTIDLLN